jgi:hypothetical protein
MCRGPNLGVAIEFFFLVGCESLQLRVPGPHHPFQNGRRSLGLSGGPHFLVIHRRHVDVYVDAVQKWSGDLRDVALNNRRGAVTFAGTVIEISTGLRVLSLLKNNSFICLYQRCEDEKPKKGDAFMPPDEFYRGLETLGFTDCGVRSPKMPELRSYDPPTRLHAVLSSVNIGRTDLDSGAQYTVTLQASDGFDTRIIEGEPKKIRPELGSDFGPILFPMDQALLDPLALDADELREWIDRYPIFSFAMAQSTDAARRSPASEPGADWSRRSI